VPVTRNFNPLLPPIGTAVLTVEGPNVIAEFDADERTIAGLTPALGGQALATVGQDIAIFDVYEVSLCDLPNTDHRVPPLADDGQN